MVSASSLKKPSWTASTPFSKQGRRFFVGHSTGAASVEDGRNLATAAAFRVMVQEIGVTVSEESHSVEREADGVYSYDVQFRTRTRSVPVKVKGIQTAGEYFEEWSRGGREFDTWVLVSIPAEELQKAMRAAAGKVLVVWTCSADVKDACTPELKEGILSCLTRMEKPLLPDTFPGPVAAEDLASLGENRDAAYVLSVEVEAKFLSEVHDEYYASARAVARYIDTGDSQVLSTVETGDIKGGHYSKLDAVRTALKNACKDISSRIATALE